jgi:hypothetical protein
VNAVSAYGLLTEGRAVAQAMIFMASPCNGRHPPNRDKCFRDRLARPRPAGQCQSRHQRSCRLLTSGRTGRHPISFSTHRPSPSYRAAWARAEGLRRICRTQLLRFKGSRGENHCTAISGGYGAAGMKNCPLSMGGPCQHDSLCCPDRENGSSRIIAGWLCANLVTVTFRSTGTCGRKSPSDGR